MTGGLPGRSRDELATLVPEFLLAGHLIDRASMPHLLAAFGREVMRDIAIEEWMGASPVYTRRMQRALDFEGDSVETIFKGIQLDIGAPPQYMDFRYRVIDHDHGEFWLDHCGALLDVEPMGADFVTTMCHDIEDPTFDATAVATNAWAQVRPLHRPPREPADRVPVCHWRVDIDTSHDPLPVPPAATAMAATRAAGTVLSTIDPDEPGRHDYAGPLLTDLDFSEWSRSALLRMAEEVCLQGHLLVLSGALATVTRFTTAEEARDLVRKQFAGVAGVVAERLHRALGLGPTLGDAARLLSLHPALLPETYTGCRVEATDGLVVRVDPGTGAAHDGAWTALLDADHLGPLDAIVQAVDRRFRCRAGESGAGGLTVEVVRDESPAPVPDEVTLTRFSTGASFAFEDRGTPVVLRRG